MQKTRIGIVLLLFVLLFTITAQALEIECLQTNALGAESEHSIMKAMLDNGQTIYYLSREEDGPGKMEDVNFDGHDDFVPIISLGASNFFCAFFPYNPQSGQYEPLYGFDQGFCNYTLDPDRGYVISSVNDGYQYGETKIFRWQGDTLVLLRSAKSATVHTVEYREDGCTEQWDFTHYEMIVYDHTKDEQSDPIIYQQTYPNDDPQFEEHQRLLNDALWNGI